MLKYTLESCKTIIAYRAWQYEYNAEYDQQFGAYSFASAGMFITNDRMIVICTHGVDEGEI
jgi:hypothetical protein